MIEKLQASMYGCKLEELRVLLESTGSVSVVNVFNKIIIASENGDVDLVNELMGLGFAIPAKFCEAAFCFAARKGHLEVVKALIKDMRVNPGVDDNLAIRWASWAGHSEIVKLLMRDNRVDPTAVGNEALELATGNGHLDVVNALLTDERVDPVGKDAYSIMGTYEVGAIDILEVLLRHSDLYRLEELVEGSILKLVKERIIEQESNFECAS